MEAIQRIDLSALFSTTMRRKVIDKYNALKRRQRAAETVGRRAVKSSFGVEK